MPKDNQNSAVSVSRLIRMRNFAIKIAKSFIFVFAIFAIATVVVCIAPWIFGIYSLWERRNTSAFSPEQHASSVEYYQYRPKQTLFQKILPYLTLPFKILLLPLYIYGLGFKIMIGLPIYIATLIHFFCGKDWNLTADNYLNMDANKALLGEFNIRKCIVEMPNHVMLHTCEYTPAVLQGDINQVPHIIYFTGNGTRYEEKIKEMCIDALKLNAKVIGFHHSNFGQSGLPMANGQLKPIAPRSQTELVQEGIAQVQRLLDKGVDPKKIVLHGHSLGGGIATLVAVHFNQLHISISIYNDRSFSSISNVAIGYLMPEKPSKHMLPRPIPQKIIDTFKIAAAYALKPIIKGLLMLTDWDLNAGDVIHKIPQSYWDYLVIRHVEKEPTPMIINDGVIPYTASLHQAPKIRAARKQEKQEKQGLSSKEQKDIQARHKFFNPGIEQVATLKLGAKEIYVARAGNGQHMESPWFLSNRQPPKTTAGTHFHDFMRRAG